MPMASSYGVRKAWRWSWLFRHAEGIAVDCDGHIWVTDSMQNRVHLFTQEGDLLMWMGNKQGVLPGTFSGLQYIMIDSNRVFTSDEEFRYVTQDEAQRKTRGARR
jgi:hypothetical protein